MADLFKNTYRNNTFKGAVQNTPVMSKTHNGADTFESSMSPLVDLFFVIGASRGKNIERAFEAAYGADQEKALRMLFWARDIRGGAGERKTFRNLMKSLETNHPRVAEKVIHLIPEYGRWDDLLIFSNHRLKQEAFKTVSKGLKDKNTQGLCAKWMPRKGKTARELREYLKLSPKAYRKLLVSLSKGVVEVAMCAKECETIDFNKVPSLAAARYQKAFMRNAAEKYQAWKDSLVKAKSDPTVKAKVNASAVYPHDVLKSICRGDAEVAQAQWDAMPNYLGECRILPVCDVSGSMGSWGYYGGSSGKGNVRPIDISISLGLYIADKQEGAFKDLVCTFSTSPKIEVLKGDIVSKAKQINSLHWEMSTNIEGAFKEILKIAVAKKLPQEELPDTLLIISDMEFDQCTRGTAYATAKANYQKFGYKLPRVVFWNVNARLGNDPVTFRTDGTALVSGFSPSILKSILSGNLEKFTPENVMDVTIMSSRYDPVGEALKG